MLDYWERKERVLRKQSRVREQKQDFAGPGEQVRLASLVEESIVDGPGMRFVLFTQGCPHRCPGCHNPQTHLLGGGTIYSLEQIISLYAKHPASQGMTFSGGEPFLQGGPLAKIARVVHERGGDVVTYTGYRLERLEVLAKDDDGISSLLQETDLLIDGPFVQEQRSLETPFVGSSNQRLVALSPQGNRLLSTVRGLDLDQL